MSKRLEYLVWHCTATPEGRWVDGDDIIKWHTSKPPAGRGWKQVGYSKLVLLDGTIHSFVDENDDDIVDNWEITNGVAGINSISRHYCYAGGLDKDTFEPKDTRTPEQLKTMKELTLKFIARYKDAEVKGHYHFAAKACPCFNVEEWLKEITKPELDYTEEAIIKEPVEIPRETKPIHFFEWLSKIFKR